MRVRNVVLIATVSIALSSVVRADDIVYFTNGTAMPVKSHKVEKGMIRVDLGNNSAMAFPVSMVEKVESSGRNVFPGGGPANQAVASAPNTTVTGASSLPSQYRQSQMRRDDPEQQLAAAQARAQNGGSPYTSPTGANTAAKRNLRVIAGGTPVINEDGTYRRGNVAVMPAPNSPIARTSDESKPIITTFGPPDGGKQEPVAEESSGDGDEGGGAEPDADDPPDQR